jgi:predicted lipoprotein with Yx(FWY)xxD motif
MRKLLSPTHRPRLRGRASVAALAVALGVGALVAPGLSAASIARSTAATTHAKGVEIATVVGPFGPQLIVGNGPLKGFSLYAITRDSRTTYGCTTYVFHGPGGGAFPCVGPETSQNAEWPALTTTAAPVAGPGVTKSMLSSVFRKGVGHQVVYNGHPLYLFDHGPGQITGEGWDEPSIPPWRGQWWLVNPSGSFEEWNQTLTATKIADGTTVLAALMNTGIGYHSFPLYESSADTSNSSACGTPCSRVFEPLLTTGTPGIQGPGVTGGIGSFTRADGTTQVTYNGHPLYLYSDEGIDNAGPGAPATGSGDNKTVGSGTFHLVIP